MLSKLHTFCVIVEEGSFRKAAEKLFLSQPSVSQQVALLEKELRVLLFDRTGHKVALTPGGKTLYGLAQEILNKAEDLPVALSNYRSLSVGTLELGTTASLGVTHLPGILKGFMETFPSINVNISCGTNEALLDAVGNGDIEMAILGRDPNRKNEAPITYRTIFVEPLVIVASPDLVGYLPSNVKTEDLEAFPFIGYTVKNPLYTYENDFVIRHQVKFRKRILVDDLGIAVAMAKSSLGMAMVNRESILDDLQKGALVPVGIRGLEETQWEIQVAYHTYRGLSYAGWTLLKKTPKNTHGLKG